MGDVTLRNRARFDIFFGSLSGDDRAFDVTDLPGSLWPHLYLLDVHGERLIIRLTGDAIRKAFRRDLRGVDLMSITHGAKADDIKTGYDLARREHRRVVMRRLVHLQEKATTQVIECGFAPLLTDGAVKRIVGCLFVDFADRSEPDYGATGFHLETV